MTAVSVGELVLKRFAGGHHLVSVQGKRPRYEVRQGGMVLAVAHSVPELAATLNRLGLRSAAGEDAAGARRVPARGRSSDGRRSSFGRALPHQSR